MNIPAAASHKSSLPLSDKGAPRIHLDYLDGLRACAALYVVVFHVLSYHLSSLNSHERLLLRPLNFGHDAVGVFIVLSGFCLMLPIVRGNGTLRGGAWGFFKKRAKRILPPYYFAMLLSLLLIWLLIGHKTGTPWDTTVPVTFDGLVAHLLLLQDVFNSTWAQINSPFWSISVEWRIYFAFPLLVWAWRHFGPWKTTAASLIIAYVMAWAFLHVPPLTQLNSQLNGITPQYLGLFSLGMLAAGFAYSSKGQLAMLRERCPWRLLLGMSLFALIGAAFRWHGNADELYKSDLFVGTTAGLTLVLASTSRGLIYRFLSCRALVWVGSFSYSLYLIHYPVLQLVWQYLVNPLHLGAMATLILHWSLGIPCAVIAAYGFHRLCERPFMTQHSKETPAEVARDAALSPAP